MIIEINHESLSAAMSKITKSSFEFSPEINPLVVPSKIRFGKRLVSAAPVRKDLVDPKTGEMFHLEGLTRYEEVDRRMFVQIFKQGIKEMYELSRTATKAFHLVLDCYELQPLHGKRWSDSVTLFLNRNELNGRPLPMHRKTFDKGLKELLVKQFLAPKTPEVYWVNPHLFFIGDKIQFIKAYKVASTSQKIAQDTKQLG